MKTVKNSNKVDKETLKTYEQIDVRHVIKEWLLLRGVGVCKFELGIRCVKLSDLVYMALIDYGLKSNATNKMYVDYWLRVGAHRCGLTHTENICEVPEDIYNEAKQENEAFAKGGKQ